MQIWQEYSHEIALSSTILSLLALAACTALYVRVRRFSRPFDELAQKALASSDLAEALQAQVTGVSENRQRLHEIQSYTRQLHAQTLHALQAVGFHRYDAFDDIRGQQSYSLCLLDAHQDGFLLSSIAGHTDSRAYAKLVREGEVEMVISEEETKVLQLAKNNLQGIEKPLVAAG